MALLRYAGASSIPHLPEGARLLYEDGAHIFFGYYDITPFSSDGRYILANRVHTDVVSPHSQNTPPLMEVGYFDLTQNNPEFISLGKTSSWNWQQGCRLQWLGKGNDKIIFNIFSDDQFKSCIISFPDGRVLDTLDDPVYAVDDAGEYAITLNFSQLHEARPGYGYHQKAKNSENGLSLINVINKTKTRIITLQDIKSLSPTSNMAKANHHYINHADFIPNSKRIQFFHIWLNDKNKKNNRLITLDREGNKSCILVSDMRPAHYTWLNNKDVLVTGLDKNGSFKYALYCDNKGHIYDLPQDILDQDGHPSVIKNFMISDTYPSKFGRQNLFIFDMILKRKKILASFYMPNTFSGEMRCDLHPRIAPLHNQISVDMVYNKHRAQCILPVTIKD